MGTESQKTIDVTGKPGYEGGILPTPGLYAALLENSTEAIMLFDEEGLINYQNRKLFNLTGFTAAETTGKLTYNYVHPGRPLLV